MAQLLEKLKPPPPPPPPDPTWGKEEIRRCIANFFVLKARGDTLSRMTHLDPVTQKTSRVRDDTLGRVVYKPKDKDSTEIGLFGCWKCLNSKAQRYVDFVILRMFVLL